MASTFKRPNSSSFQCAILLPDGSRETKSLHTPDAKLATRTADSLQKLVDALTPQEKARQSVLRVLVEDIFIAA